MTALISGDCSRGIANDVRETRSGGCGEYGEEGYQFGLAIQKVVRDRDLEQLFSLVDGELRRGPRRASIRGKSFSDVFDEKWRETVLSTEPDCGPVGYRGFMLGSGMIWYHPRGGDHSTVGIFAFNGWIPTEQYVSSPEWKIGDTVIHPECFYLEWWSSDNYQELIADTNCEDYNYIGQCLEREGGVSIYKKAYGETLAVDPVACSARCQERNPVDKDDPTRADLESGGDKSYSVVKVLPLELCDRLAPYINHKCIDLRLVELSDYGGGSMSMTRANIYGLFSHSETGENILLPLANLGTVNNALNYIDYLEAIDTDVLKK